MNIAYCPGCGIDLSAGVFNFCPECGYRFGSALPADRHHDPIVPREERETTVSSLLRAQKVVNEVFRNMMEVNHMDASIAALKKRFAKASVAAPILIGTALSFFLFALLINISIIATIFGLIIAIGIVVLMVILSKRSADRKNERLNAEILDCQNKKNFILGKIREILASQEGTFARSFLPQDYFYPDAVERFLYYFNNGHCDTMKEAVREYDEYLHRAKMEFEARRSAIASERTAFASERAAAAAQTQIAQNAAISAQLRNLQQDTANISFWTQYSAFNDMFR